MFTSAELIEALRRRTRRSLRPEIAPGEFPEGWREWFATMRARVGAIHGASADAIVAILALRELRQRPTHSAQLNRWQGFASILRQQWDPVGPDGRWQRITALTLAVISQLLVALFVLWLAYAQYGGEPLPPGEDVVQVEFIGKGTPVEEGGGAPSGAHPQLQDTAPAAADQAPRATAQVPPTAQPGEAPPAPAEPAIADVQTPPQPQPPTPIQVAQPLQVTEVVEPDVDFVVPPTGERAVVVPQAVLAVPTLQSQPEALPSPAPPMPATVVREVRVRPQPVQVPGLAREAEALPAPGPPLPGVVQRTASVREGRISVPGLKAQATALPSSAAAAPGVATAGSAGASTVSSKVPANAQGSGSGAGPKSTPASGAWSTATRGDDWGVSDRNRSGGQRGNPSLLDQSGRPGLSPPVVTEDIANLDRAGKWLKRPPVGYTATRFEQYWLPGESLLEEWVRRGVKQVQIPIPGTTKSIHCVVSLLQLGGGCAVADPDLQDQEAGARPPPVVPWKPELQEH